MNMNIVLFSNLPALNFTTFSHNGFCSQCSPRAPSDECLSMAQVLQLGHLCPILDSCKQAILSRALISLDKTSSELHGVDFFPFCIPCLVPMSNNCPWLSFMCFCLYIFGYNYVVPKYILYALSFFSPKSTNVVFNFLLFMKKCL